MILCFINYALLYDSIILFLYNCFFGSYCNSSGDQVHCLLVVLEPPPSWGLVELCFLGPFVCFKPYGPNVSCYHVLCAKTEILYWFFAQVFYWNKSWVTLLGKYNSYLS